MRWLMCVPVLTITLVAVAQQDRPEELVKSAIAAAGGAEVLEKFPAGRVTGKGTMTFAGVETAFMIEQAYQIPGKLRTLIRCEIQGQKWELLQVLDGETGKQKINGRLIPMTDIAIKELQLATLLNEVAQLTTLGTDRKFTLKPDKVEKGHDQTGLFVQVRGQPDFRLGFDRKSGHLTRIAYKAYDPDTALETEKEILFSEFKEYSGLTRATRSVVNREGKPIVDLTIEKFTPLNTIDPKAFTIAE
jgi:hypothetical protein